MLKKIVTAIAFSATAFVSCLAFVAPQAAHADVLVYIQKPGH